MAIAQSGFNTYRRIGFDGQVSTIDVPEIVSGAMQGYVSFGRAVTRADGEERTFGTVTTTTTANDIVGFAVRSMASYSNTVPSAVEATEYQFGYHDGEHASAIRRGRFYAYCVDGATAGSPVVIATAAADGIEVGQAMGGGTGITLNQVKWVSNVAAGEIGEIRVDGILNVGTGA